MLRLVSFLITILFSVTVYAQTAGNDDLKKSNPYIRLDPAEYNLGVIEVNEVTENT